MEGFASHPCSCPREQKKIVEKRVYHDPKMPPSICFVCTSCNMSNCPFYISEKTIGHYHSWDTFVEIYNHSPLGLMCSLKCNSNGCHSKVYVLVDNGKKHYLDEPENGSSCKRFH